MTCYFLFKLHFFPFVKKYGRLEVSQLSMRVVTAFLGCSVWDKTLCDLNESAHHPPTSPVYSLMCLYRAK